jgi:hypothetical protein
MNMEEKRMFKRIMSIMMVGILAVSLTACGKAAGNEVSKGPEGELSDIIDQIYEQKNMELMLETTKLDLTDAETLKYYTGLSEATLVKEAAVSEAMITSQAYSLALVRVKDSKDAKTVAKEMLDGINPNKWICVGADDLKVAGCGDVVLLIMVDSNMSDTVTAEQMVEAFKTVSAGKLDFTLEK